MLGSFIKRIIGILIKLYRNGTDALRVFPLDNKGYKISNHGKIDISPIPASNSANEYVIIFQSSS